MLIYLFMVYDQNVFSGNESLQEDRGSHLFKTSFIWLVVMTLVDRLGFFWEGHEDEFFPFKLNVRSFKWNIHSFEVL